MCGLYPCYVYLCVVCVPHTTGSVEFYVVHPVVVRSTLIVVRSTFNPNGSPL